MALTTSLQNHGRQPTCAHAGSPSWAAIHNVEVAL